MGKDEESSLSETALERSERGHWEQATKIYLTFFKSKNCLLFRKKGSARARETYFALKLEDNLVAGK